MAGNTPGPGEDPPTRSTGQHATKARLPLYGVSVTYGFVDGFWLRAVHKSAWKRIAQGKAHDRSARLPVSLWLCGLFALVQDEPSQRRWEGKGRNKPSQQRATRLRVMHPAPHQGSQAPNSPHRGIAASWQGIRQGKAPESSPDHDFRVSGAGKVAPELAIEPYICPSSPR
jgi:hypothetical protein